MNADAIKSAPPGNVVLAVRVLWAWIGFLALSGIYDAWAAVPQVMSVIPPELAVPGQTLFLTIAGGYLLMAATMIGVVIKAGRGKKWARLTLVISFILDLGVSAFSSYQGFMDYLITALDIGLQVYALWLLFTGPSHGWFRQNAGRKT